MKILLDECVPARLRHSLPEHDVVTTPQAGWAGIRNGELLLRASTKFEAFVTVDRNLAFQQDSANLPLPVIVIHCRSNKLADLTPHVPALQAALLVPLERRVYHIGSLRLA